MLGLHLLFFSLISWGKGLSCLICYHRLWRRLHGKGTENHAPAEPQGAVLGEEHLLLGSRHGKAVTHADHLSLAFSTWSHSAEIRKQHVALLILAGVFGCCRHLIAGGGCSSAWGKGSWASLLHDVNSRRDFLLCPRSPVALLCDCSKGIHTFPMSMGTLLYIIYCSVLLSCKSSTFHFHVLNPSLGKLCKVWGMKFHHSFPPLPSQVGHPARLTDGSLPCLAAQLLIYQITESCRALGTRQWQPRSSQPPIHHGDAWIHLHQLSPPWPWPPTPPLVVTELGRNPFLVQREFGPARRERSRDLWARAGGKQGFKLYIDIRKQTPLPLSPLKFVLICLLLNWKLTQMHPVTTCIEPVHLWIQLAVLPSSSSQYLFIISQTVACS